MTSIDQSCKFSPTLSSAISWEWKSLFSDGFTGYVHFFESPVLLTKDLMWVLLKEGENLALSFKKRAQLSSSYGSETFGFHVTILVSDRLKGEVALGESDLTCPNNPVEVKWIRVRLDPNTFLSSATNVEKNEFGEKFILGFKEFMKTGFEPAQEIVNFVNHLPATKVSRTINVARGGQNSIAPKDIRNYLPCTSLVREPTNYESNTHFKRVYLTPDCQYRPHAIITGSLNKPFQNSSFSASGLKNEVPSALSWFDIGKEDQLKMCAEFSELVKKFQQFKTCYLELHGGAWITDKRVPHIHAITTRGNYLSWLKQILQANQENKSELNPILNEQLGYFLEKWRNNWSQHAEEYWKKSQRYLEEDVKFIENHLRHTS